MEYDTAFDILLPTDLTNTAALRKHFISATLATHIRKMSQSSNPGCYAFSIQFTPNIEFEGDDDEDHDLPSDEIDHMCNLNWLLVLYKTEMKLLLSVSGTMYDVYTYYNALLQRLERLQTAAFKFFRTHDNTMKDNAFTTTISKPLPSTGSINKFVTTGYVRMITDEMIKEYTKEYVTTLKHTNNSYGVSLYLQAALWLEYESGYFQTLTNSEYNMLPGYDTFIEDYVIRYTRHPASIAKLLMIKPGNVIIDNDIPLKGLTLKKGKRYFFQYPTDSSILIQSAGEESIYYSDGVTCIPYNPAVIQDVIKLQKGNNTENGVKIIWNNQTITYKTYTPYNRDYIILPVITILQPTFKRDTLDKCQLFGLVKYIPVKQAKKMYKRDKIKQLTYSNKKCQYSVINDNGTTNKYEIGFIFKTDDNIAMGDFHRCRVESLVNTKGEARHHITYILETGERLIAYDELSDKQHPVSIISFQTATGELLANGQKIRLEVQTPKTRLNITCIVDDSAYTPSSQGIVFIGPEDDAD